MLHETALEVAAANLRQVLDHAIEHRPESGALVVWDGESELSNLLAEAYRRCLPQAQFVRFDGADPQAVRELFEGLGAGDLAVLIQSTSFRLDAFRIRIELFKRGLKVIEHPHLARMTGPQARIYVDALAYDRDYYRGVGHALRERIDRATRCVVDSGAADGPHDHLIFPVGFEPAKVNIGDYTDMANVGGQYPIGEVFTESADLEAVHGRARIAFFGDTAFTVNRPERPITLVVERGRVVGAEGATPEFERVLDQIRVDDGDVRVRELGFGMNRALTSERTVSDIGTFERMCGVHLSLGAKHATYNKADIRKKSARHHVDVFVITESVQLDGEVVYRDGAWTV
ncbi:hypothetical protein [Engelhardtia mirabilis]|uniref:Thermophilic metalloprotease (M29) n=1 Tax=Engelhardtia mirabilis TaxID=2528011 RepID=A0A518BGQ9_9BACT|nr:Thermophilic metalloprotease (M29) [Planctomycetes bacterium Pla133]QDV00471.1 Thermophilic metalloprotease (M29) [Planctomycetes bacterium Pla86]